MLHAETYLRHFLTTQSQHKLQRNLHCVTLAAELHSTFFSDCIVFNHCKLQSKISMCNMTSATCNGFIFPTMQDKLQGKFHRVTLALIKHKLYVTRSFIAISGYIRQIDDMLQNPNDENVKYSFNFWLYFKSKFRYRKLHSGQLTIQCKKQKFV